MNLSLRFFSNKLRIATYKSANLLNSIWKIGDPVEKSDNMLFNANDPRNAKLWRFGNKWKISGRNQHIQKIIIFKILNYREKWKTFIWLEKTRKVLNYLHVVTAMI
jgi:hypothetical protein